jgi:hypothetical protein
MPASFLWEEPGRSMALAGSATSRRLYLESAFLAAAELGWRSVPRDFADRCEVRCDTLTELDVRDTAFCSFLMYQVDPKPPVCIVAGPPRATAGGSMRKPGTLSSWEL